MAAVSLKMLSLLIFSSLASSKPISSPNSQYAKDALVKRANLDIVKTTFTKANTIDWIPIQSQGQIASPPPQRVVQSSINNASIPIMELEQPGVELGPSGTVPVARMSLDYLTSSTNVKKQLPPKQLGPNSKRQYSGDHWYVTSDQAVSNIGGTATYSVFDAYVENSGDFSLLQTAVTKSNVPLPGNPSQTGGQTLEAGWINYPAQVSSPHLFTYYTTNGYTSQGNNVGGWNQDVQGWVQVDSTIFPGTVFAPDSTIGGTQYELQIAYQLYEGNWWLWVLNRWIGYYPASLYSANEANAAATLADGSDTIFYYGEIYQSESALTTTDMGSGMQGATGFGNAAYIHNMVYMDPSGNNQAYTAGFADSDSSRYSHSTTASPAGSWGSYVYLGGPGAGGVVGG